MRIWGGGAGWVGRRRKGDEWVDMNSYDGRVGKVQGWRRMVQQRETLVVTEISTCAAERGPV